MTNCQNNKIALNKVYKGDTWNGFSFQILDDDNQPIDVSDVADVFIQFKRNPLANVADFYFKLSENTIVKDADDVFKLVPILMNFEVGIYNFDVQIIYDNASIRTIFAGDLSIIQDVTR